MDINLATVVQGGMLAGLIGVARVVYNTSVLCARLDEKLDAQVGRVDRIEERVDGLAS